MTTVAEWLSDPSPLQDMKLPVSARNGFNEALKNCADGCRTSRRWSPDQRALVEKFGRLLVRLELGLAEPSGQMYFDFGDDVTIFETRPTTAEDWFQLGCRHEEDGAHDEAINAYRKALLRGGPDADTSFNLANVLYAAGRKEEASERYRQTVEMSPDRGEAWNNLGVVLSELERYDEAEAALARAIEQQFADAHFNLAGLQDRHHWRGFLSRAVRVVGRNLLDVDWRNEPPNSLCGAECVGPSQYYLLSVACLIASGLLFVASRHRPC